MTDYTPTTEVIRHALAFPRERLGEPRPIKPEAFDRWLAQVKAEAWNEGHHAGQHNEHEYRQGRAMTNPYRQETET